MQDGNLIPVVPSLVHSILSTLKGYRCNHIMIQGGALLTPPTLPRMLHGTTQLSKLVYMPSRYVLILRLWVVRPPRLHQHSGK